VLKKMGLENDKLIKRDPDFIGDVLDSMNEDIDMQEEQKISLEEAIMQAVFGEAKKAPVTKKDDDGDGMDPVGQEDGDVDNDGDKDSSDDYLKKRRKAVGKAIKKTDKDNEEKQVGKSGKMDKVDTKPALDEENLDLKNSFDPAEVKRIMESFEPNRFAQYGDRAEQVMELTAIKIAGKKHK